MIAAFAAEQKARDALNAAQEKGDAAEIKRAQDALDQAEEHTHQTALRVSPRYRSKWL
jgi:hypothetical protein